MKGIILAGGTGSRLAPLTNLFSKQLLPVYDKPLIYYPLATLMAAQINDILIISTPRDESLFKELFKNISQLNMQISFATQMRPGGIGQSFTIGEKFIGNEEVALILGDNIFHGTGLGRELANFNSVSGAQIFGYRVSDPENYGVANFDSQNRLISIEEKPISPKSNIAIPGLYFYDNEVVDIAKNTEPSSRGEVEITAINNQYLNLNKINLRILPRGTTWLDTGTFNGLHDASTFVRVIQERQGTQIACIEEISWRNNWIDDEDLNRISQNHQSISVRKYLTNLLVE